MEENRTFSSDEDTLAQVRGIIRNARNHPSVILYSIFNEEPLQGRFAADAWRAGCEGRFTKWTPQGRC